MTNPSPPHALPTRSGARGFPLAAAAVRVALAIATVVVGVVSIGRSDPFASFFAIPACLLVLAAQTVGFRQIRACTRALDDDAALTGALTQQWKPPWRSVLPAMAGYLIAALSTAIPAPTRVDTANAIAVLIVVLTVLSQLTDIATGAWTYALSRRPAPSGGRQITVGAGRLLRAAHRTDAMIMIALIVVTSGVLVAFGPVLPSLAVATIAAQAVIAAAVAAIAILRGRALTGDTLDTTAWRRIASATTAVAVVAAALALLNVVVLAGSVTPTDPSARLALAACCSAVAAATLGIAVVGCLTAGVVHRGRFAVPLPFTH